MNTNLAEFDGLTLRATGEQDGETLEKWIAGDDWHRGELEPDYFIGDEGCFAIEDQDGVVFYIRLTKAARVRIQFDTENMRVRQKARVARALEKGMALLEVGLSRSGVDEWVFDTRDEPLRGFAKKHLGFRESEQDLVREIAALEAEAAEVA
jgi:hypothetical protein